MSIEEYNEEEENEMDGDSYSDNDFDDDYSEEEGEQKKSKKGARIILIIAVLLLIGLNGFLGWKLNGHSKSIKEKQAAIELLEKEKSALDSTATALSGKIDSMKVVLGGKDKFILSLEAKVDSIRAVVTKVSKERDQYYTYRNAKIQYNNLLKQFNAKQAEIDSLNKRNEVLAADKRRLEQEGAKQLDSINTLVKDKKFLEQKYELAKKHKVAIASVKSYRVKGNGSTRETDKASQVNKISVDYKLMENSVADKGKTEVYISILNGNKVLAPKGKVKLANGKEVEYTIKDEVNYAGVADGNITSITDADVAFTAGKYTVKIYVDGALKNSKDLSLR